MIASGAGAVTGPPGALADGDTPNEVPQSGWDANQAVAVIYRRYYRQLVREAALLVGDRCTAEDVVQDSFIAMHGGVAAVAGQQ